jgi:hypothetical protein
VIKANLKIELPINNFKNIYCILRETPFPHKFLEFQVYRDNVLIGFNFEYTVKTDHAGLWTSISLFFISIDFQIYDNRHWDFKTNTWETY